MQWQPTLLPNVCKPMKHLLSSIIVFNNKGCITVETCLNGSPGQRLWTVFDLDRICLPHIMFFDQEKKFFTQIKFSRVRTDLGVDQVLGALGYEILLESLLCFAREYSGASWTQFTLSLVNDTGSSPSLEWEALGGLALVALLKCLPHSLTKFKKLNLWFD